VSRAASSGLTALGFGQTVFGLRLARSTVPHDVLLQGPSKLAGLFLRRARLSPNAKLLTPTISRQSIAARCVMGICLQGAPRQQCAEDQIGDNGFQQGAGWLVASRDADLAGDNDAGG
jgi:hypothetical protein